MSLRRTVRKYVHVAIKLKNSMKLKKDLEILYKLGLEEAEVGGF